MIELPNKLSDLLELAPWVKTVEVCQHSAYCSASVEGILFCMCSGCGHCWQVMLCPNGREFCDV